MIPVSIVMPIYNTPVEYLREAVDSMLNQTFSCFEFIIINDGSDGDTKKYLQNLKDPRIVLHHNKTNIGVTKSLNIGLQLAQGKYIARMDGDDISSADRLEKQYTFMESHAETVMCGCAIEEIGTKTGCYYTRIKDRDSYRIKALFYYPGPKHPTMFIRREILTKNDILYHEDLKYAQDYALCVDLSRSGGDIACLPEVLLKRRNHEFRITSQHYETQKKCSLKTQHSLLLELLGEVSQRETEKHYRYFYEKRIRGFRDFCDCFRWSKKLIRENHRAEIYPKRKFDLFTIKVFLLSAGLSFTPAISSAIISARQKYITSWGREKA